MDILFCRLAEPSEEAGGDKNRRRQTTNHTSVYRSAGHGVGQQERLLYFHWWTDLEPDHKKTCLDSKDSGWKFVYFFSKNKVQRLDTSRIEKNGRCFC